MEYVFLKKEGQNISPKENAWIHLMHFGKKLGCHQMPERSFFIAGYQFPVCARCTGVMISSIAACVMFFFYPLGWQYCIGFCGIMFLDWLIQRVGIKESTNIRRLITGLIGGYGCMTLQLYIYQMIATGISDGLKTVWR
jgi:uncharacterized membrane protein